MGLAAEERISEFREVLWKRGRPLAELLVYGSIYYLAFVRPEEIAGWTTAATVMLIVYPLASNFLQRRTWAEMGLESRAFIPSLKLTALVGMPVCLLLLVAGWHRPFLKVGAKYGLTLGSWVIPVNSWIAIAMLYPAWTLAQQYVFMGFVVDRLNKCFEPRWKAVIGGGTVLFAVSHWPNPTLMAITAPAGIMFLLLFRRHRNFLPLALLHALLGLLVFKMLGHHGFSVGRYY